MLTDRIRILVVDDDWSANSLITIMLERHEYTVIQANSVRHAFAILKGNTFDLFVKDTALDLFVIDVQIVDKVDGLTGMELLRWVHNKYPHIPILAIAEGTGIELLRLSLQAGASEFMVKPVMHNDLADIVRPLLEKPIAY